MFGDGGADVFNVTGDSNIDMFFGAYYINGAIADRRRSAAMAMTMPGSGARRTVILVWPLAPAVASPLFW